jgi:hypothetical protein
LIPNAGAEDRAVRDTYKGKAYNLIAYNLIAEDRAHFGVLADYRVAANSTSRSKASWGRICRDLGFRGDL